MYVSHSIKHRIIYFVEYINRIYFSGIVIVVAAELLGKHLNGLLQDAENRIHELSGFEVNPNVPSGTRASFSSIIGEFNLKTLFSIYSSNFPIVHESREERGREREKARRSPNSI